MKIKWSLDINTGAVERSEAARARRLAGATVVGLRAIAHDEGRPYISAIDGPGGPIITGDHLTRDSTICEPSPKNICLEEVETWPFVNLVQTIRRRLLL